MTVPGSLRRVAPAAAVAALLALYAFLATSAAATKSHTFDEIAHITAGYAYWTLGDYRLQPENGNWPQRLAGLPAALTNPSFPPLDDPDWRRSDVYALGRKFFFERGNDVDRIVANGRAMIALLGVMLGVLVFAWSRRLNGAEGSWISLVLFVVCPTLLAHGPLATSDMAAALGFTAATGTLWMLTQRLTITRMLVCGLSLATVFLSKFSAPVLVPIAAGLLVVRVWKGHPLDVALWRYRTTVRGRGRQVVTFAALALIQALLVWGAIWVSYGFRYEAFHPRATEGERLLVDWPMLFSERDHSTRSRAGAILDWTRTHRLLPEAYIYGLAHTVKFAQSRRAFMDGEHSLTGWRSFFPYAFLVKTPLPLLLLLPLGVAGLAARARMRGAGENDPSVWYAATPWLVLTVVYWAFAITTNLNIGHRHLLPVYPAMLILAGGAGTWMRLAQSREAPAAVPAQTSGKRKARATKSQVAKPSAGAPRVTAVATLAFAAWHAAESFRVRPHYLAYFNQLAGGPYQGYRRLVDSSLDWGQDLPTLAAWLAEHAPPGPQRPPVYLSYFGTSSPAHFGIDAVLLESYLEQRTSREPVPLRAGYYCVSATMLQGVYLAENGPWTAKHEDTYRMLGSLVRARAAAGTPEARAQLDAAAGVRSADFWVNGMRLYDELRTAKLMEYLRRREPIAHAGYSILIYRLTDADLKALGQ